jgi:chromosomal replication initiator protein
VRSALEQEIGSRRYQNWFGKARLEIDGAALTVAVPSPYLQKWIQKQFQPDLLRVAAGIVGADVTISYEIDAEIVLTPLPKGTPAAQAPAQGSLSRRTGASSAPQAPHSRNKRMYSLSDFVIGPANELAMAGVQQFLVDPASTAPLYLYGGVGNGKTHLLEGLRSRLRKDLPQLQTLMITAEHFCNYFTQALAARTLPSFRSKFRNVDVLLVDDIDFFDGKKGLSEEFLHTIKQMELDGRHVVVSSNRHPRLLLNSSDELVSRLLAGLVCRIESPDAALRLEVVQRRVTRLKSRFAPDAMEYVASRFTANVRELEGAVNVLATWSQMSQQRVTVPVARKLLGHLERDCLKLVRLSDVESSVCEFFGIEKDQLRSSSRKQSVSQPRMLAMYLCRKLTQSAYSEIGAHFGGRNHSTVMSAEKKVAAQLQESHTLKIGTDTWSLTSLLQTLEERIKAG